jgi:hypothetical protein
VRGYVTVREAIEKLSVMDPEALVLTTSSDHEWGDLTTEAAASITYSDDAAAKQEFGNDYHYNGHGIAVFRHTLPPGGPTNLPALPSRKVFVALDYNQAMAYLEARTGRETRNWTPGVRPRVDFWDWFLETQGPFYRGQDGGSLVSLREHQDDAHLIPEGVREILALLFAEFRDYASDGKLLLFVDW